MNDDVEAEKRKNSKYQAMFERWAAEGIRQGYHAYCANDVRALFKNANFTENSAENFGGMFPQGWPCAAFVRTNVLVLAHPLGYEVYLPDNPVMACFPDAALAIQFVQLLEQEVDLMSAAELDDGQFGRVQKLAAQVMEQAWDEADEDRLKMLHEWSNPGCQPASA